MTREEALKIAKVIGTADGGCDNCVHYLVEKLNEEHLGFTFLSTGKQRFHREIWFGDEPHKTGSGHLYVKVLP